MTNACLSSGRSEFKTCPNCGGEGWEPKPPMRKCRLCRGSGRLSTQTDKPLLRYDDHQEKEAHPPSHEACYSVLEAGNDQN